MIHPVKKRGLGADADPALVTPQVDPVQESDQTRCPALPLTILMAKGEYAGNEVPMRRQHGTNFRGSRARGAIDIGAQFHVVTVGAELDAEPVRSFRSFTKER
jgi:hypothetical protein